MMQGYRYSYLIMVSSLMLVWLFLFLKKDYRKEMLFVSLPFGFVGLVLEYLYVKDWWNPVTLAGSSVSIEDFFFGFAIGGIAAVLYEEIFSKRIKERRKSIQKKEKLKIKWYIMFMGLIAIFYICYFVFNLNTFLISVFTLLVLVIIIWIKRKDLILDSLITGLFFVLLISAVYTIIEILTPGWVEAFWYFKNTPKIILWNLPLDDIIFYFLFGAAVGPLYEYWQEGRLIGRKA